jgi:hypothetical protein
MTGEVSKDLEEEYQKKRIQGAEYAEVYHKLMGQALQLAYQCPLNEAQVETEKQRAGLTEAQKADQLYVTANIRPLEAERLRGEIDLNESKKNLTDAQTADQIYVTNYVRPIELEIAQAEARLKDRQADIAEKELELKEIQVDIALKDLELKAKELELMEKELALREADVRLKDRQIQGFDDNLAQKLLEIQMNSWSMMFSSGLLTEKPQIITSDEVSRLYSCIDPCTVATRGRSNECKTSKQAEVSQDNKEN